MFKQNQHSQAIRLAIMTVAAVSAGIFSAVLSTEAVSNMSGTEIKTTGNGEFGGTLTVKNNGSPVQQTALIVEQGRVGFGTSMPTNELHVSNSASGPIINLQGANTNYRGLKISNTNNSENWFVGANNSNVFTIRTNGAKDVFTANSGAVFSIATIIEPTGTWENVQFRCEGGITIDRANARFTCNDPRATVYEGNGAFQRDLLLVPDENNNNTFIIENHLCLALGGKQYFSANTAMYEGMTNMAISRSHLDSVLNARDPYYNHQTAAYANYLLSVTCVYL